MIWRNWTHSHFVIPGLINQNYSIRYINTVSDSTVIPRCFLTLIHLSIWQSFDSHPKGFNLVQTFWQEKGFYAAISTILILGVAEYRINLVLSKEIHVAGIISSRNSFIKIPRMSRTQRLTNIYLFTTGFEWMKALCL